MSACICGDTTDHPDGRAGPIHYEISGRHHRPLRVSNWREGMVIWNWSTNTWDRVELAKNHPDDRFSASVRSRPIDEDDDTEWRSV